MARHQFGHQAQRFSEARRSLMLPHPWGEDRSLADAFNACLIGMTSLNIADITDEDALGWIDTIKKHMSTEGVEDPAKEGKHLQKARLMTTEEKREFSHAVDQLAHWFDQQFWAGE